VFLTGWAVGAIFFGVVADYVGRVRVLITGVLLFSVFTALSVVVVNYAEFVTFRFIAGIGSGVELPTRNRSPPSFTPALGSNLQNESRDHR
jgi:MFS family permease